MSNIKYERLITKLLLGENIYISNFNTTNENNDSYLTFNYSTPYDDVEKTCIVQVNLNTHSVKETKEFIKDEFYPEFSKMLNKDDDNDDVEEYMEGLYSSPDEDEDEDEEYESESSVAAGCGFYIDDDGNWTPDDSMDDCFYNYEYPRVYEDRIDENTVDFEKEYSNFMVKYRITE